MMSMDDQAWARHANPWSVYSRFSCLPLIALAIWSRVWLGWWSLIPIALSLLWVWGNPRVFPPPRYTDNWASKVTFGERIFMRRKTVPIPKHHDRMAMILAMASAPGVFFLVYGLAVLDPWAVIYGVVTSIMPKVWFVDRMVWLYDDMRDQNPEYKSWLKERQG